MRIGILTSGGDCPGINATIRGVCKTAINYYGMEVVGIHSGFQGLLTKDVESFTDKSLSGLLNLGGTMLGTSREKPFKKGGVISDVDKPALILQNIREMGLDCVVCIGGNGTQKTAAKFAAMGVNIVSVPKTIDNDIWGTDISFGFDSAVSIATDAIDRLHSTASSHKRVMVIEVMGHKAGWIALYSGMAGGGDVILVPEIPYSIKNIGNTILERLKKGKPYSIVVVAEGIQTDGRKRAAEYIAQEIEYETGTTLTAAQKYPHRQIWCVFQPHTYTRTKAFFHEFADALSLADKIVLADIYAARETDPGDIHSRDIQKLLLEKGKEAYYFPSFEEIEKFLREKCINGDLLITMGAGDVVLVGEALIK